MVVTPYIDYPQLLGVLLRMLNEGTLETRKDLLKASRIHAELPSAFQGRIAVLLLMLNDGALKTHKEKLKANGAFPLIFLQLIRTAISTPQRYDTHIARASACIR